MNASENNRISDLDSDSPTQDGITQTDNVDHAQDLLVMPGEVVTPLSITRNTGHFKDPGHGTYFRGLPIVKVLVTKADGIPGNQYIVNPALAGLLPELLEEIHILPYQDVEGRVALMRLTDKGRSAARTAYLMHLGAASVACWQRFTSNHGGRQVASQSPVNLVEHPEWWDSSKINQFILSGFKGVIQTPDELEHWAENLSLKSEE